MNLYTLIKKNYAFLKNIFLDRLSIDLRALATLRISLGILILCDLVLRIQTLVPFYTDSGVLPRYLLYEKYPLISNFSIHTLFGGVEFQIFLFLLTSVFAIALIFGYKTKSVTILSWLLLLSLHIRNPLILNGGDSILRRLLFWGIFLPLGGKWSIDSLKSKNTEKRVTSIASAVILIQVVIIYSVDAIFKLKSNLWFNGQGMINAFVLDRLTIFIGDFLTQFPSFLRLLGIIWFIMLSSSIFLIIFAGRIRAIFTLLFISFHFGMIFTMNLGLFPLISIAGLFPFLPEKIWEKIEYKLDFLVKKSKKTGEKLESILPELQFNFPSLIFKLKEKLIPLLLIFLLCLVLFWNLLSLGYLQVSENYVPSDSNNLRWDMFSSVPQKDVWFVVIGTLESGNKIDALRLSKINWRPKDVTDMYPNHRWMMYMLDLPKKGNSDLLPPFVDYICNRWNKNHENKITNVTVYYFRQFKQLNVIEDTLKSKLINRSCPM